MYFLFEGLDGIKTKSDVFSYYRESYFDTDLDVTMLLRTGADLQYSYGLNGADSVWSSLRSGFMASTNMSSLVSKYSNVADDAINTYIVPNQKALKDYRDKGYFD
jgi:hypothetical protein